ncbi:hypothetical protein DM01DRAFT_1201408 [Hesseltinella vesiculosa]|uniref:PH domain-containing protein n=1 Tax=Hesseltinella vesiculosa TaxID=101127 RepID=A0A1X2G307_9FUNG|nr:hypothetical protein DM01DRAFT_1201408 [Hesseltinella vesiculosa]
MAKMISSPNTIISIGLQVKPDIHVKPLTGFSRLFTSIQKQKEHLSGYVHPSDYLLGQSRFALQHMMDACNQKVYNGCFDLFNSWYVKSAREKRRALDSDIVKIIGNIKVDLLYLPMSRSSTQTQIPRTLKECDLALKIRQWHNTMWVCGYISVRQAEKTVWSRSFYQLVGSRLLEFSSHRDTGNLVNFYDIGDVAKLIVAAEQTLVDVRGETFTQIFTQDTICDDNSKGFFRIAFTNGSYIDCICDRVEDSELWVSMLKTMVGKVPVRKPF